MVVDDVGNVDGSVGMADGGCAGIVDGAVVASTVMGGVVRSAVGSFLVWVAVSIVVGPTWVLASLRVVGSASFDAMAFTTSITSISCPSSTDTQWP